MEGVFCFKSWFLNAPGLIHCGAYSQNFTVCIIFIIIIIRCMAARTSGLRSVIEM